MYQAGSNRYNSFCSSLSYTPFPTSEHILCLFVARLFQDGLSSASVKCYLSAVRYTQIASGFGDPRLASMPQLEYVTKGLRRQSAKGAGTLRLPITPQILLKLQSVWKSHPVLFDATMLWAASCMCFFGFLRSGEVVAPSDTGYDQLYHLSVGDVRVDSTTSPLFIEVYIKASKTDPFRQGVRVYLGRTNSELCPVAAVLAYMVERQSSPGPFFKFVDGRYLTRARFVSEIRAALQAAGVPDSGYSGHSFRIGAATTAVLNGVPDSLIKTMGRWQSSAYTLYIRTPRETLCSVARALVE